MLTWTRHKIAVEGLDSSDGNYRIIRAKNGRHRLISFIHDDDDGEPRWWDFDTIEAAKAFADKLGANS